MKYKSDKFYTFESMVFWTLINHYNNITEKEQKHCSLDPNEIKKKNIEVKERFQKITKKEMNGKANCGYKRQKRKILVSHVE